jgi:hypothetical protein
MRASDSSAMLVPGLLAESAMRSSYVIIEFGAPPEGAAPWQLAQLFATTCATSQGTPLTMLGSVALTLVAGALSVFPTFIELTSPPV